MKNTFDTENIPGQQDFVFDPIGKIFDEDNTPENKEEDELLITDSNEDEDSNVSDIEKDDLEETATNMPTPDETSLKESALDNTDNDGELLNEGSFKNDLSGDDLDIPGAELDDTDEEIGEEDEENNEYSLGGDNHDDIPGDEF